MKQLFILFLFTSLFTSAQTLETIFIDNFEDGNAYNWESEIGWEVINDNGNYVFQGTGHRWAVSPTQRNSNIVITGKFKIITNVFHLNLLENSGRYFFGIHEGGVYFNNDETQIEDIQKEISLNEWHDFEVFTRNDSLAFSIDNENIISYKNNTGTNINAKLAFECLDDAQIQIDDLIIKREQIVYNQDAKWVKTGGPLGGIGYDVRVDPNDANIIYVTDNWAGIHKSYDGGRTWLQKINGIYSRTGSTNDAIPMFCLTIDPNNSNIIWAGTFGMRGVYRSTDKAELWEFRGNGIPNVENLTFRSFTIEPGNSDVVYLGCEWTLFEDEVPEGANGASRGKIYKTIDGGLNWIEVLDADALVRTIIVDPNNTNIVYAATGIFDRDHIAGSGVFKSTDGGENWIQINNGIKNLTVGDIEMHPSNSNILLAATGRLIGFSREPDSENGEILRTENGGETWNEVPVTFPSPDADDWTLFTYLEWDESDSNIVYCGASDRGFYKSTDGGRSFQPTTYNAPFINAGHIISIATHKEKPNWVIANSYGGGVFVSENGTFSWSDASRGYTGSEITDMIISNSNPEKVFTVSRTASFKTENGGTTWEGNEAVWQGVNGVWLGNLEKRSVAVHPQNDEIIITGDGGGIFYKSANDFKFEHVYNLEDRANNVVQTIKFSLSNPSVVYAGISIYGGYSIDRPNDGFDLTESSYGMLKSTDGGKTWTDNLNHGLENSQLNIMKIAVHPNDENTVYIATLNNGLYKSINGAASWTKIGNDIAGKDTRSIAIDKNNPDIIYVGTQRDGIYKSADGGNSFTKLTTGIESEGAIRDIQIDPQNSSRIYAADWLSGVYLSDNNGVTWRIINDGLKNRAVQRLAVSADGAYVYAGTQGEGVFRMTTVNKGPVLQFTSPDHLQTLNVSDNVEIEFLISAYDFNGDNITYEWFLNNVKINDAAATSYVLNTASLNGEINKLKCAISDGFNSPLEIEWTINTGTTDIKKTDFLSFQLSQNYPNPFNPSTIISYEIAKETKVSLEIFDILGRKVDTVVNEVQQAGIYNIKFDGSRLSSGTYIYRLTAGDFVKHRKMILIK